MTQLKKPCKWGSESMYPCRDVGAEVRNKTIDEMEAYYQPIIEQLLEVLDFCKKKREFEGTPKMVINQMSDVLDVIAKESDKALAKYKEMK